jgi:hypothetical protein
MEEKPMMFIRSVVIAAAAVVLFTASAQAWGKRTVVRVVEPSSRSVEYTREVVTREVVTREVAPVRVVEVPTVRYVEVPAVRYVEVPATRAVVDFEPRSVFVDREVIVDRPVRRLGHGHSVRVTIR